MMNFSALSEQQQALIHLAEQCIGELWEHVVRVLQSALYLWQREGGDEDVIIAAALFHMSEATFAGNILTDLEIYSYEAIEKVEHIILHDDISVEQDIIHDAILLNAHTVASAEQMHTATGKSLAKERKSVLRIFSGRKAKNLDIRC